MTAKRDIELIGIPLEAGAGRRGCIMGPDCYRTAGLASILAELGHNVIDRGNIAPDSFRQVEVAGNARNAAVVASWTRAIDAAGAAAGDATPIFMGGDHSLSAGSINALRSGSTRIPISTIPPPRPRATSTACRWRR
jgi:arginase